MNNDKKIYYKYLWHEHINPKRWLGSGGAFYEYLIIFMLLYSVFFTTMSLSSKAYLTVCFIIAISIIKFYSLYRSGLHRHWWKQKTGILTHSDIRKLKENKEVEGDNQSPVG